jgi:hypothetical protein
VGVITSRFPFLWESRGGAAQCQAEWAEFKQSLNSNSLSWLRAKDTKYIFEYCLQNKAATLGSVNVLFVLVVAMFWDSVDCERAYALVAALKGPGQSSMDPRAMLRQQLIIHSFLKDLPAEEYPVALIVEHFLEKKKRVKSIAAHTPVTAAKQQ